MSRTTESRGAERTKSALEFIPAPEVGANWAVDYELTDSKLSWDLVGTPYQIQRKSPRLNRSNSPTPFLFLSILSTSTSTSLANEVVDPRPSLAACEVVGPMRSRYNVLFFLQKILAKTSPSRHFHHLLSQPSLTPLFPSLKQQASQELNLQSLAWYLTLPPIFYLSLHRSIIELIREGMPWLSFKS